MNLAELTALLNEDIEQGRLAFSNALAASQSIASLLQELFPEFNASFLPEKFQPEGPLRLNRFQCLHSMNGVEVQSLDIGLGFNKQVGFGASGLSFEVQNLNLLVSGLPASPFLSASLDGQVRIGEVALNAQMSLPDTRLRMSLEGGQPLPVAQLLQGLLPAAGLPELLVEQARGEAEMESGAFMLECLVSAQTPPEFLTHFPAAEAVSTLYLAGQSGSVSAMVQADLALGDTEITLGALLQKDPEVFGDVSNLSLNDCLQRLAGLPIPELPDVRIVEGALRLSSGGSLSLSGSLEIDFQQLAIAWNIPLPDTISNFPLRSFSLSGNLPARDFSLELRSAQRVALLNNTDQQVEIVGATVRLAGASLESASITLHGKTEIAEKTALQFDYLTVNYDAQAAAWAADSRAKIRIYDVEKELAVSLGNDHFSLSYEEEIVLVRLGDEGKAAVRQLSVFAERVETDGKKSVRWGLGGQTEITQSGPDGKAWLDAKGTLALETGAGGHKLKISAEAPEIPNMPLNLGGAFPQAPELKLGLDDFGLEYARSDKMEAAWVLSARARMQILHIPKLLEKYLPPEELEGYFRADGKDTLLGFKVPSTLQPQIPPLEIRPAKGAALSLGQPSLTVDAIELNLSKKPRLTEKLTVGLPRELNFLFGKEGNQPKHILFNPKFGLQLELGNKLGLKTTSSPLAPLEYREKEEDPGAYWTHWDLGEAGRFDLRVPEFEYGKTRWTASGGFERIGQTQIPLTPIKRLLALSGVPDVLLSLFPDGIPLVDINFEDGSFKEQLNLILGDALEKAPPEVEAVLEVILDAIATAIQSLPDNLREYFKVEIPRSLILEMEVDTLGGASCGLRILNQTEQAGEKPPQPIKVLIPLGLEWLGLSIRGFHLGQKASGSMITIEFDGHIDRFNLLELAIAIPLGKKSIRNRFLLSNTRFLLPAGLPAPIPLFFDAIELDYRDVLGTELQTHWENPDPDWGLENYLGVFAGLFSFLTDKAYLFSENEFNRVLNTRLGIGVQRFRMPDFLGGKELALNMQTVSLDTGKLVGGVMDFFKTGNPGYVIQAVPLKAGEHRWIRIGDIALDFGPLLQISANWCLTTQREFEEEVLPAIQENPKLAGALSNEVLTSLPQGKSTIALDKGFIILMGGGVDLGGIVGLRAQFGMALTGQGQSDGSASGNFETGFLLSGSIADALILRVGGKVLATHDSREGQSVRVDGAIQLLWKEKNLIRTDGMIAVDANRFAAQIVLSLGEHFSIGGLFEIGKERFRMEGTVRWSHDGGANTYSALLQIDGQGLTIGFGWAFHGLRGDVSVTMPGRGGKLFAARASLYPGQELNARFKKDIEAAAAAIAESSVDQAYKGMKEAIAEFEDAEISVNGLRQSLPPLCRSIVNTINSAIDDNTEGWKKPGRSKAKKEARPFINRVNKIASVARNAPDSAFREDLKAALQDVVDNNYLNIKITIGVKPFAKTFTVYKGKPIAGNNLANLKKAIANIGRLQLASDLRAKNTAQYAQFPPREKLLAEINNSVSGSIPEIKSIAFETSLGLLNPSGMKVSFQYSYKGELHTTGDVEVDFTDPVGLSRALAGGVG